MCVRKAHAATLIIVYIPSHPPIYEANVVIGQLDDISIIAQVPCYPLCPCTWYVRNNQTIPLHKYKHQQHCCTPHPSTTTATTDQAAMHSLTHYSWLASIILYAPFPATTTSEVDEEEEGRKVETISLEQQKYSDTWKNVIYTLISKFPPFLSFCPSYPVDGWMELVVRQLLPLLPPPPSLPLSSSLNLLTSAWFIYTNCTQSSSSQVQHLFNTINCRCIGKNLFIHRVPMRVKVPIDSA